MGLSKEEIINLASRYIDKADMVDFPHENDVFALMVRPKVPDSTPLKGLTFVGYCICKEYIYDETAKPLGKWLFMHYVSLSNYPPIAEVLRLQPPHVTTGEFDNTDRTVTFCFIKVTAKDTASISFYDNSDEALQEEPIQEEVVKEKIVKFRTKSSKSSIKKD